MPIPVIAGYVTYGFGILVFIGFMLLMHLWLPGQHLPGTRLWPGVLVSTLIFMPIILAYTSWVFSVLRGKVDVDAIRDGKGHSY